MKVWLRGKCTDWIMVRFTCRLRFMMKSWPGLELGFGFRMRISITVKARVMDQCE